MSQLPKYLGGGAGSGTLATAANLYAASGTANTSTIISTIAVCNTGASAYKYRLSINTASATFAAGRYVMYEDTLQPNETVFIGNGLVLDPTYRYLNASSENAAVNFTVCGVENT